MKTLALAISVAVFSTAALFAANLGKYADWPNSPQGYFMTNADRAAWSKLSSEADAGRFIDEFLASRGGANFVADVDASAKAADERLTLGRQAGSRSLRGKIVIVLGPPSSCSIVQRKKILRTFGSKDFEPGRISTILVPNSGLDDIEMNVTSVYTFTYPHETIVVEVDPRGGVERIADTRMARHVDSLLEAAAEARAKAAR